MARIERLDARYYPTAVDDHRLFEEAVRRHLRTEAVLLDAGAGRGVRYPYDYGEHVARVVGVDVSTNLSANRLVHHPVRGDLARLPFRDASFDLVFSKFVFEHLEQPLPTMRELRRVTRPGGHLVIHTPNRFHYVALGAMLTPQNFHRWYNARRGRSELDTFPTRYRANDRRRLQELARRSGYRIERLDLVEPRPTYLDFHPFAYLLGIAYERLVSRFEHLRGLRCVIVADLLAVDR
ncbi:MAG: class I SAM-dependent methyltransferase [Actinomycetota bacterium]